MTNEEKPGQGANMDEAKAGSADVSLSEEELAALCREHVCTKCRVMQEAEESRLRTLADSDNMRKRLMRETEELRKFAGQSVLADLLPVLDNLDLALNHAGNDPACRNLVTGVQMTRKVFLDILKTHGLEATDAAPGPFDPARHEALGTVSDAGLPDGHVAQVVQKGYVLKDRVIRPAKVMVNKLS